MTMSPRLASLSRRNAKVTQRNGEGDDRNGECGNDAKDAYRNGVRLRSPAEAHPRLSQRVPGSTFVDHRPSSSMELL